MDLQLPITLQIEMEDEVIEARAVLDLASGEILQVSYTDPDAAGAFPPDRKDYDFTSGLLSNGQRDVEFGVVVDKAARSYSVTPSELLEIKGRAAKLFAAPPGRAIEPDVPRAPPGRRPRGL